MAVAVVAHRGDRCGCLVLGCLGLGGFGCGCLLRRGLGPLVWRQDHRHVAAVEPGRDLDAGEVGDTGHDLVEDLLAELGVVGLAPSERQGHLHLVALSEEVLHLAGLGVEVTPSDLRPVLHLLDRDVGRLAAGFLGLLRRFVLVLAVVHDPTDRRVRLRCHLDQVEVELAGYRQRLRKGLDPDLLAARRDEPHLAGADAVVDSGFVVCRRRGYCRSLLIDAQILLCGWLGLPAARLTRSGGRRESRRPPAGDQRKRRATGE